nr:MFS transporter [Zhihengliuella flava]
MLAALIGSVGIGTLLIYGLSATSDLVMSDLGLTEAQFGLLATTCFGCATLGNALLGRFADRQPDRTLMLAIFGLAAAALAVASLAQGLTALLIAAGLTGFAQSFPNGVTNRILIERVPARQRIGWTGIKQSGVQAAQLIASLAFPAVAVLWGWRGASALGVGLAVVLAALAVRSLGRTAILAPAPAPAPELAPAPAATPAAAGTTPSAGFVVWALAAFGFLNGLVVQATNVYVPLFAVRELGFSLVAGGATAAVAGAIGVTARIGWGRVMGRGVAAPALLLVLALTALAGAGAFFAAHVTGAAALLWLAVALHGASALGVSVVLMAALLRSIPAGSMASASGRVSAGMFAGFTLGPLIMGALLGSPGGFAAGWIAVAVAYAACAGLAGYLLVRRRRRLNG